MRRFTFLRDKRVNNRERFLRACQCASVDRPPVWLMRQAGRCLPEYQALKQKHSFHELVRTPDLATEITLQPIRRFNFDAAVLFCDLLVIPEAMGQPWHYFEKESIASDYSISSREAIQRLDHRNVSEKLEFAAEAIRLIKTALRNETALIGFAGSPWTLAAYMIEGSGRHDFAFAKALLYSDPKLFGEFMEKLTDAVIQFLQLQISAGVDAVQIFDSAGGALPHPLFEMASARWTREVISAIQGLVPVILFSKGVQGHWDSLVATGANVLGMDWTVPLAETAGLLPNHIGVQGNLDPALLLSTPDQVILETSRLLSKMKGRPGYIFNLGHGVPPAAKIECIQALVDTVRNSS